MSAGLVVGRTDCDTCGSDHFVIVCTACGRVAADDFYEGGTPFRCACGADVTPTVEQVSRWSVYEFDVLCDQHDDCKAHDELALACWKGRHMESETPDPA